MEPEEMTHEVQLHFNPEYSVTLTLQMSIKVSCTEDMPEEDCIDEALSEAFPGADYISYFSLSQE